MIKLYGLEVSGNTYKVKLFMHLLGLEYQFIELDIGKKQHKSAAFMKLNPRGEFPLLEDENMIFWDSQAILVYLAQQYANPLNKHWYPDNPAEMAHITQWLCVANNEIFLSMGKARSMLKFGYAGNLALYQQQGTETLCWIEQQLTKRLWLSGEKPSIADIACYPYIALCEEANIPLAGYTAIHDWIKRIQHLKGYIPMPGLA